MPLTINLASASCWTKNRKDATLALGYFGQTRSPRRLCTRSLKISSQHSAFSNQPQLMTKDRNQFEATTAEKRGFDRSVTGRSNRPKPLSATKLEEGVGGT